jgi:hypothetical protein
MWYLWCFLRSVPRFKAPAKNCDLLTSGDLHKKLIGINFILINRTIHKQQYEGSSVQLFPMVP